MLSIFSIKMVDKFGKKTLQVVSGRYNVYMQRSESAGTYDSRGNYRNGSPTKSYFYSIGFDDVKKFKYKNLKVDLADFSGDASLEDQQRVIGILEKGKKRSRTRSTLIWSGVGVMLVGIGVSQLGKGNDEPTLIEAPTYTQNEKLGLAITAVGLGISVTGLVMKDERKFYLKAVEEYNRIYSY
jgi:hypothetical protein